MLLVVRVFNPAVVLKASYYANTVSLNKHNNLPIIKISVTLILAVETFRHFGTKTKAGL